MKAMRTFTLLGLCVSLFVFANCEKEKGLRINGIDPTEGSPNGGGNVTILGNGFQEKGVQGGEVYFGDSNAKIIKFEGNDKLIVEAPSGEPGSVVDVTVRFDDAREHTYPGAYTYQQERQVDNHAATKSAPSAEE